MLSSPCRNLSRMPHTPHTPTDPPASVREDHTNNGERDAGEEMGVSAMEAGSEAWLTAEGTSEPERPAN